MPYCGRCRPGGQQHHQHDLHHGVPRRAHAARLRVYQGRHTGVHERPGAAAREARDPRQRRGAGADLDAAHPRVVPGGAERGRQVGHGDGAHGPSGAAVRVRHCLRLPRVAGRLLLHRPSAPPQRRLRRERLIAFLAIRNPLMEQRVLQFCGTLCKHDRLLGSQV